ncbi:hypothetical protein FRX31_017288 [Thalictrum thalictroides]|uniref:Tudor domain-containing protein n=1 Tax=Thalictrum thalictroides TaxID=46969 RepID=A0A7J6W6S3_THATH|nr:hypothetical protein FRX31_017288 [Thalictrum thalictroides]
MESEAMKAVEKKENGVLTEDVNVEKPRNPPKKQKRGADGEIVEASLLLPEKDLSKLRPRKSVPSFRKVELNESDFERIVGKRVKVYWSGSRKWFTGCIKSFDNGSKLHKILYDDGDKEDLDLKVERFELEVLNSESFNLYFESGSHHKKKERSFDDGEVKEAREKIGLHGESSKDQVTSEDVDFVNCMDDLGSENGGQSVARMLDKQKGSITAEYCSSDSVGYENPENNVKNDVLPDKDNVEKPSKKQKRGADGEVTEVLLSLKRELPHSKLRPRKLVPSFQKVELNECDFETIIGKRVKVYWSGSRKWFVGCIKSFDNDSKLHRILYDDGDKEDLDLKSERFELEVMNTEAFNLGSNHKKERGSYGGDLKKEMTKSGLLSAGDVGFVKKHSKENIMVSEKINLKLHEEKATQNRVFLKEKLHESAEVKAHDVTSEVEFEIHGETSKDQVTGNDVKFVRYRGYFGRGQSVSKMLNGKPDNHVKNNVQPEEGNVDKPPKKRKRGTNGDITGELLSSSNDIPNSKLRPRKSVPSFRKVELSESDFKKIVGRRVKVYWSGSRRWFIGCIKSFDSKKKLHKILYDDGGSEDLNLKGERFELEVMTGELFNLCFKLRPNPKENVMTSDGDISGALLSSSNNIPNSKLRPRKSVPSFQKVELSESDFQRIVGRRVKVYWSGSRRWFSGCIKSFDSKKKLHKILYDDGESEDLNLKGERFELEVMSGEPFNLCFKLRPNPKENVMTSDGGMVNEELKKNGSLDVANVGQVKKNAPMNRKTILKATRKGRLQLHQGKGAKKTQDMDRDMESDELADNNNDQVTCSEDTYWQMYVAEV